MKQISPSPRVRAFETSISDALRCLRAKELSAALSFLRRSHVLGQRDFRRHLRVHSLMLLVAWRRRDPREVAGQLLRLALTPLGHLTGRLPEGNSGTADVSAFASQAIPAEIAGLLAGDDT